ncbi:ArsR/SmtB family transcription factor [Paenibacillus medicaginis]|uniref:ArsR/SmtB family transcription factor n=1 Tax=Paenibacillus medicaginis TaxID=1470560 RepID=A0ABV5C6T9_9BACL
MSHDTCEIYCYNEETVHRIKEQLSVTDTQNIAKIFKVLADDTRMKVAFALCQEDELCVCDVANIIGSTVATASHHLRLLRNMGLANYRKEGKLVFYSLDNEHVKRLIMFALEHGEEEKMTV